MRNHRRLDLDHQSGFTLVELGVVLGILATLIALATTNLLGLQRRTQIQTTVSTLVADLYAQRQRAMSGDTQGRSTTDAYGVYLQTTSYTLFHGTSYSATASDNVVVPYENPVQMSSTTFPSSTILFSKGSGEITGYSPSNNSIILTNTSSNQQITLSFNTYGTITSDLP